jgi:hypothetical protein
VEVAMKLNTPLIEQTLTQFQAQAIPEDHPVMPELSNLFGDHTFFIDNSGLHIVEPGGQKDSGEKTGKVVKLASWNDTTRTSLVPHEPEVTDEIMLEAA